MPESGHKSEFPGRDELHAFLQTLKGEPGAMFKALDDVAHGTVEKWYREKEKGGTEITSVYLLRVLLTLGAVDLFAEWLKGYASPVGETLHQAGQAVAPSGAPDVKRGATPDLQGAAVTADEFTRSAAEKPKKKKRPA